MESSMNYVKISLIALLGAIMPCYGMLTTLPKLDSELFERNASQYGYKAAYLMELEKLVPLINEKIGYERFAVPSFRALRHEKVAAYLKEVPYKGTTVFEYLQQQKKLFITAQKAHGKNTLVPQARDILAAMQLALRVTFTQERFAKEFPELVPLLEKAQGKRLIVRSTGINEDRKDFSNAGGNESIVIEPLMKELAEGVGMVIGSYSSEKSLSQRIAAGDQNLFNELFFAVLVQTLVGTSEGTVSGVLFTQEAEGRTPGVCDIRATWGQNDALVNSLVGFDSYFVGPSGKTHSVIGTKLHKSVPAEGKGTKLVPTTRAEQRVPCLATKTLTELKVAAEVIEEYMGQPQDIEFVVEDRIYLVQTRPITYDETVTPSYTTTKGTLALNTISSAGGAARVITSPDEVLVTEHISTALSQYMASEKKDALSAIVIGTKAPATSHEATIFRSNGKAILQTSRYTSIKKWLETEQFPFVLDTQRECALLGNVAVIPGWYTHPISQKVSIVPTASVSEEFLTSCTERCPGVSTSELLERIKNEEPHHALEALYSLMHRLLAYASKQQVLLTTLAKEQRQTYPEAQKHLLMLMRQACVCAEEVKEALSQNKRIARLYPMTFLEALIRQVPQPRDLVNDYSLGSEAQCIAQEEALVEELHLAEAPLRSFMVQYAKLASYATTQETECNWKGFLQELADVQDEQLQRAFAHLIRDLAQLDILGLWLNLSFVEAQKTSKTAAALAQSLITGYKQDQEFLSSLHDMKQLIQGYTPDSFSFDQWDSFCTTFVAYFTGETFLENFRKAQKLGKMAALTCMNQFFECFDRSIKALKGREQQYRDKAVLLKQFKTMIQEYGAVLTCWYEKLSVQVKAPENNVTCYFETIVRFLEEAPLVEEQLLPNTNFSIAVYVLGAARGERQNTLSMVEQRPTCENLFSLTHRNLLTTIGSLAQEHGMADIPCPEFARDFKKAFDNTQDRRTKQVAVEFQGNNIRYVYDWPIRNHGIVYTLTLDKATQEATVTFEISTWRQKSLTNLPYAQQLVHHLGADRFQITQEPHVDESGSYFHTMVTTQIDDTTVAYVPRFLRMMDYISELNGVPVWDYPGLKKQFLESDFLSDRLIDEQESTFLHALLRANFLDEDLEGVIKEIHDLALYEPGRLMAIENDLTKQQLDEETTQAVAFTLLQYCYNPELARLFVQENMRGGWSYGYSFFTGTGTIDMFKELLKLEELLEPLRACVVQMLASPPSIKQLTLLDNLIKYPQFVDGLHMKISDLVLHRLKAVYNEGNRCLRVFDAFVMQQVTATVLDEGTRTALVEWILTHYTYRKQTYFSTESACKAYIWLVKSGYAYDQTQKLLVMAKKEEGGGSFWDIISPDRQAIPLTLQLAILLLEKGHEETLETAKVLLKAFEEKHSENEHYKKLATLCTG